MVCFSKTTGDTVSINYYDNDTTIITVLYDRMENVFGTLRRQWGFYEKYKNLYLDNFQEITDGIGLTYVQATEASLFNYLSGAIIDGVEYGNITSVKSETKGFTIYQNYPNPFNSSTIISLSIQREGNITIRVYDILGREMATLFEGRVQTGLFKTEWDGKDYKKTSVGSGIYFYRVEIDNNISIGKMILLR